MRQGTHFATGFCHESVIFWTTFSDAGLAAAGTIWDEIGGDDPKHFVNHCGDGSRFVFGSVKGICKLAQSVQTAFEGDASQIDVVGERGFLHDAPNEVVGYDVHGEFAFDHRRRFTTQYVHIKMDFNLAETKFDAPTSEVEFGEVGGRNVSVEQGGHQRHALGAKATFGDAIAHNAHGEAFGQKVELGGSHCAGTFCRAFPRDDHVKVCGFGELGADGFAHLIFRQTHEAVHFAGQQAGNGSEGAKPPVGDGQIARFQGIPDALKKPGFVAVAVAGSTLEQSTRVQAENANQIHQGKTTAGLLAFALRPTGLIGFCVRHGDAGAVDEAGVVAVPERIRGDMSLQTIDKVVVDLIHYLQSNFGASLAVGAGIQSLEGTLLAGKRAAHAGHDFENSFAAGGVRRLHLIQKTPENHIKRENTIAAVAAGRALVEQSLGNVGTKDLAELGQGTAFGELGKSFREGRDRRLAEKQRSKCPEKRS